MTIYALIKPDNTIDRRADNIDPTVQVRSGYRWIPVETTMPSYDPATQVRTGPVTTVEETRVTDVWTVRAKTAAELDADKDIQINDLDIVAFKVLFNHENRIRALENKAAITATQFKTGVKALL